MNEPVVEQQAVADICQRNHVAFLGDIGSRARGEETTESDIDLDPIARLDAYASRVAEAASGQGKDAVPMDPNRRGPQAARVGQELVADALRAMRKLAAAGEFKPFQDDFLVDLDFLAFDSDRRKGLQLAAGVVASDPVQVKGIDLSQTGSDNTSESQCSSSIVSALCRPAPR